MIKFSLEIIWKAFISKELKESNFKLNCYLKCNYFSYNGEIKVSFDLIKAQQAKHPDQ
jgi:hypothetical protein